MQPPKKLKPAVWHQIHRLDWRCVLCGYFADLVPCLLNLWYCASCSKRRTSTELPTPLRLARVMFLMIFESSGGPIGWCSSRLQIEQHTYVNRYSQSGLDATTCWKVPGSASYIEAGCHCRSVQSKVSLLGRLPGPRKSRCSFLISFLWMTGMQVSMPCPQCGLMFLWWGSTYARYDFHHIRKKYDVPSMWGNVRRGIIAAAPWNQGAWMVLVGRKRGAALYQQI